VDAAGAVRRLRRQSRLVAVADEVLGRRGRMVEAIRAIGRGEDAFEGVPFTLPV